MYLLYSVKSWKKANPSRGGGAKPRVIRKKRQPGRRKEIADDRSRIPDVHERFGMRVLDISRRRSVQPDERRRMSGVEVRAVHARQRDCSDLVKKGSSDLSVMSTWHIGKFHDVHDTGRMTITTGANKHDMNDQVVSLIETYRQRGDRRAIERILSLNTRILNQVVRRYTRVSDEPYEDLLQVGYVGLMKAVKGFKLNSEAKFSSYAYSMIDGEIRHHLRDTSLVKKPRWARSLHAKVSEATSRLTAELGRPPLVEEVAREVNITPEGVSELMKLFSDTDVKSLDASENEEFDVSTIKSLHYETFSLPVEDCIVLEQALASLSELQSKVVYLFFYKDLSQTEIGQRLSLPQRKISRIVASATKSMRKGNLADRGADSQWV
jgi:RNA polymerase sigma-B factor